MKMLLILSTEGIFKWMVNLSDHLFLWIIVILGLLLLCQIGARVWEFYKDWHEQRKKDA
jgi:hypothetical protein